MHYSVLWIRACYSRNHLCIEQSQEVELHVMKYVDCSFIMTRFYKEISHFRIFRISWWNNSTHFPCFSIIITEQ